MNADPAAGPDGQTAGAGTGGAPGGPSEEELRATYEAELARVTVTDMLAQTAVSLLNLAARRLGPPPGAEQPAGSAAAGGRDLEQAGDAIDGVRALLGILERRIPQEVRPLRDALSQLQMAYAHEAQAAAPGAATAPAGATPPPGAATPTPGAGQAHTADAPGGVPTGSPPAPQPGAEGATEGSAADAQDGGPGPAESSGRLWVPGR
jgi:hypothetical protein